MSSVHEARTQAEANKLLDEGWSLIAVGTVGVSEGTDSFVSVKYVLGFPMRAPLDD